MVERIYVPGKHSAEYRGARNEVNTPSLETLKPIIYPSGDPEKWQAFNQSLQTFPERRQLQPWSSDDPDKIRIEAMQRGILIDKFPAILTNIAKRKRPADYWEENPGLLETYVNVFDKPEFQTGFEFPWNVNGAFVIGGNERTTRETIYSSLVQDDPKLFTPEDFSKAGKLKVGVIGMGVGASVADSLLEFGVRDMRTIDGGDVLLHDFARFPNAGFPRVGMNHAEHWALRAYEMYPYGEFEYHKQNLGDGTNNTYARDTFLEGLDLVVEVVDNVPEKMQARKRAAELGVPVYMTTDVLMGSIMTYQPGEEEITVFPRWTDEDHERINSEEKMDFVAKSELASKLVGPRADYWVTGAREGRSNWSQNGSQTAASKVAMSYTLRRIVRGLPVDTEKEFAILDDY
jgi:molybdopterin/thiamine biosynthesis adenylyltransferase